MRRFLLLFIFALNISTLGAHADDQVLSTTAQDTSQDVNIDLPADLPVNVTGLVLIGLAIALFIT